MPTPSEAMLALLTTAAETRARGGGWEAVAAKVARSAETVRRWPHTYPEIWLRLWDELRREIATEYAAYSRTTLRLLAADKDKRLRLHASKYLSDLDVKLFSMHARTAPPKSDGGRTHDEFMRDECMHVFGRPPEEITDEEVASLIAEGFREHVERQRAAGTLQRFLETVGVMEGDQETQAEKDGLEHSSGRPR